MTTKRMTTISLFTALIIVFTVIIPPIYMLPGVPVTLQVFVMMLAGLLLKPVDAFLCMFLYLVIGAIGLPVFSGGKGGIGVIFGPTGGFIISFPIVAYLISLFSRTNMTLEKNLILTIVFGIIVVFLIGTVWLDYYVAKSYKEVLIGMLIFIPFDLVKAFLASVISIKLKNII